MLKLIGYWSDTNNHIDEMRKELSKRLPKEYGEMYLNSFRNDPPRPTSPYIHPSIIVDKQFWKCYNKEMVIKYLQEGKKINYYRGFSSCRLCGEILGACEKTDGVWCWPDKIEHYVEKHDVKLPTEFLDYMIENEFKIIENKNNEVDKTFWKEWCKCQNSLITLKH
jgi:hypothetical protein